MNAINTTALYNPWTMCSLSKICPNMPCSKKKKKKETTDKTNNTSRGQQFSPNITDRFLLLNLKI